MFWNLTFSRKDKTQTQVTPMKIQMTKTSCLTISLLTFQAAQMTFSWDQWLPHTQSKIKPLISSYWTKQPLTKLLMRCLKPTRVLEELPEKNIWRNISIKHGLTLTSTRKVSSMLKKLHNSWDFLQMTKEWVLGKTDSDLFGVKLLQNYLSYFS